MNSNQTRRSLLIGAGLAVAAPKLVRADSIVDIPWNMRAAQRWATESFNEYPGTRIVFSDGSAYGWHHYNCLRRCTKGAPEAYAVAIEVSVTDAKGRRSVNTIPVDGLALTQGRQEAENRRNAALAKRWATSQLDW